VLFGAAVLVLAVAGCGRATALPSPTPADFTGIVEHLTRAGIGVREVISGDAGCQDPTLTPTAIALSASGLDQVEPVRIRIYIFRNLEAWGRLSGSVAACAHAYVTDPETYESFAPSPYVVSGQGPWAPRFAKALEEALTAAAGTGN
jgi:hypothetical protein